MVGAGSIGAVVSLLEWGGRLRQVAAAVHVGQWRGLVDAGIDGERRAGGAAGFIGGHRHHPAGAALAPQLEVELVEFGIDHRGLEDHQSVAGTVVDIIAAGTIGHLEQ